MQSWWRRWFNSKMKSARLGRSPSRGANKRRRQLQVENLEDRRLLTTVGGTVSGIIVHSLNISYGPPDASGHQTVALFSSFNDPTVQLNLSGQPISETHSINVDWGDGTVQNNVQSVQGTGDNQVFGLFPLIEHTYQAPGAHDIQVTVSGGDDDAASLTLQTDHAPTATGVHINNTSPTIKDTVTAVPDGVADVDGDHVSFTYEWTVGGSVVAGVTGDTLDLSALDNIHHGDTISVTATPS